MKEQARKMIERKQVDAVQEKYEEILGFIKKLIQKGNLYRIIIRKPSDQAFMEVPLTAGIVVVSIFLFFIPGLLALGALIALFKQVRVEIVRSDSSE